MGPIQTPKMNLTHYVGLDCLYESKGFPLDSFLAYGIPSANWQFQKIAELDKKLDSMTADGNRFLSVA